PRKRKYRALSADFPPPVSVPAENEPPGSAGPSRAATRTPGRFRSIFRHVRRAVVRVRRNRHSRRGGRGAHFQQKLIHIAFRRVGFFLPPSDDIQRSVRLVGLSRPALYSAFAARSP
ncbi:unnamed protein product, partial [Nesidiocoris tenuis]